ncbi:hypothetical protein OGH69_17305 [Flavobacterium sp. MFBS3-15]|uniref:hypothetical protein n=1 Tax=Flavobacterium sp. MFBS3-15 TaxID=2989816 RepID=UPI002235ACE1|nr:hypothetical protein [Flavobacterium sp. MFBS3-15]MCW4470733.1 hypothetical protein [Flavobacterium sp. MFBS3-15]
MKPFIKILGIVAISELVLGMAAIVLRQSANTPFILTICSLVMQVLSLPLSLINRTYPYYSTESGWLIAFMVACTYLIHSVIIYLVYKSVKKQAVK